MKLENEEDILMDRFSDSEYAVLIGNLLHDTQYTPLYKFFEHKMPYESLWCIISLHTKLYERSDLIRQTYYTTTNT